MVSEPRTLHASFIKLPVAFPPPRPNDKLSRPNPLPLLLPKPNPRDRPPQLQPSPQKNLERLRVPELRHDQDKRVVASDVGDGSSEGEGEGGVVDAIARDH